MINVGIGEWAISNDPHESIVTHALGSCIAIIMHCRKTGYTALAHVVLPKKSQYMNGSKEAYYADETMHRLLDRFLGELASEKRFLSVTLIGGAESTRINDNFQVGKRNLEMLSVVLNTRRVLYDAKETGDTYSRTVTVKVKNGKIKIRKNKMII